LASMKDPESQVIAGRGLFCRKAVTIGSENVTFNCLCNSVVIPVPMPFPCLTMVGLTDILQNHCHCCTEQSRSDFRQVLFLRLKFVFFVIFLPLTSQEQQGDGSSAEQTRDFTMPRGVQKIPRKLKQVCSIAKVFQILWYCSRAEMNEP
jgi:hypothetical protein